MKRNIKGKKNNKAKISLMLLTILVLSFCAIILNKNNKSNTINDIKLQTAEMTNNIGSNELDVTNQIALKPNKPQLSAGMIPIKYKDGYWQITTSDDAEWYDYSNAKMANVMLNDGVYQSEQADDMTGKKLAQNGTRVQESDLGTIFTWIPKFAYNESGNVIYLKAVSSIAGDYITSTIFTYKGSSVDKTDIALRGIWVEKESKLSSSVISSMQTENNTFGLIGNVKTERTKLDTNFINAINVENETGINNISDYKAILKVVDEKLTEPIMAVLSAKGKNVTVKIIKTDNGIKEVRAENGDVLTANEGNTEFTYKVEKSGINKFIIIDNIGNQRLYEVSVIAPEIIVTSNVDNYIEYNGEKWYPYGTTVQIKYADDMTGLTGYYQEINGTILNPTTWSSDGTTKYRNFTLNETMKYKAKIENSIGELLGEDEQTIYIMPKGESTIQSNYYTYNLGGIYPVQVTGMNSGSSSSGWNGIETYSYSTVINYAATHMGLVKSGENKILYIKIVPSPQGGYSGIARNGITTTYYGYTTNGYIFVTESGEEIKLPQILNIQTTEEDNKINVVVNAESYNGDKKIQKYYYSIDGGEFVESESNEYVFENVQAYKNHTIQVYVKDSFELTSEPLTKTSKSGNAMPIPTIEIIDEDKLEKINYDGKVWYPYYMSTTPHYTYIRINYAEDMTNLTGYYKIINETTGVESGWNSTSSASYSTKLNESMTYVAKLKDSTGAETEEVRCTINIMPNTSGTLQTNYYNNIGAIYPVRSTGSLSGYLYGTETYTYSSYINISAVHMGLLEKDETKNLYIKIVKSPEGGYKSTTRNGITSDTNSKNHTGENGYIFVTEDGTECRLPIIESTVLTAEEDKIITTVTASTNLGEIQKYYYSIDDGAFIETDSNVYAFENVQAYQNHTIKAYVKNDVGTVSDVTSVTGKTANNIPTPTIEIVNEDKLETVEYDGKIWYPYGTQIKITYAEDMTNLTGYYKYIYDERGTEAGWYSTTNSTITLGFNESGSKVVKIIDKLGRESEEVSIHLNIMANYSLQSDYYTYGLGKIYPVQPSTYTGYTVKGTDTYTYDSYIPSSAQHMGLINAKEEKLLYIKIVESPVGGYKGTTKNGITSNEYTTNCMGYIFVKEDGTEIKTPRLNSITATGGENSIAVNVDIDYKNGAVESKYYYNIDGGTYIETTNSEYIFENVAPYKNHTINVYVKDSNGVVSETFTTTSKPLNEVPAPIIEIVNKDTLETVEYDGKIWYPYGTQVKITYAEDITNLATYYDYIYQTNERNVSWNNEKNNSVRTISANQTTTYYAKNVDSTGEEVISELKIYIMPGSYLQVDYARKYVDSIFPVIVTGSASGSIYGNKIYSYDSYFGKSAMQMGILKDGEKKLMYVKVVKRSDDYYRTVTQNGISSSESFSNENGYVFVDSSGNILEYKEILKTNLDVTSNSIKVIINGENVDTYYYSINNGSYISSKDNMYEFYNLSSKATYLIKTYVKYNSGISSEIMSNTIETKENTANIKTMSSFSFVNTGTYGFKVSETSLIPTNGGNQGNKHNTVASSYIELDFTKFSSTDVIKIVMNAEVSSEGADYGSAIITTSTTVPSYSSSTGRILYAGGEIGTTDYWINVQGGQKYYLHIFYRKDHSIDRGSDIVKFNSLYWEKTTDTSVGTSGNMISGININSTTATGEVTISVPENTTYIEYKGEKWYPYNTVATIKYSGTNIKNYYAYRNEITGSTNSWSSDSSATRSFNVYESTTYFAKITDSSGNIVAEKSMKINILPNNANIQNSYVKVGNIYPVLVSYYTGGNLYGTNIYSAYGRYISYISTAATHMGLVKQGETNKLLYIKMVNYPTGGYVASTRNGITSSSNTSGYEGFMFVDENGKEILINEAGTVGATLSGYNVINNGIYNFINDGTSIIPNNKGIHNTVANSYIELDLSSSSPKEFYLVTLNAQVSSEGPDYGYATITDNLSTPSYNDSTGRFVYISGNVDATDYITILMGGKKYYLHIGYRKDGSVNTGSDIVKFNSLSVVKKKLQDITLETSVTPIEYDGKQWYPYGTQFTISSDTYCERIYIEAPYIENNSTYAYNGYYSTKEGQYTISTKESINVNVRYIKEQEMLNKDIYIMPYQYGMASASQTNYYNNIGAIYPVQVTGTTGTVYGTVKYTYDSSISVAATHMGLVNLGETKTVYIKIIETPEGGYKANSFNEIVSKEYTTIKNGYVFVDDKKNEILEVKLRESNTKLSGYNVYKGMGAVYYFANNGESIKGNGDAYRYSYTSGGNTYWSTAYRPANSYIELDYSNYTENDLFKVILNVENTDGGYAYATITTTITVPNYSDTNGRFVYITGQKDAENYETIIKGGKKYYLHLGRYHTNSSNSGNSYYAQFNSLSIEQVSLTAVPTIEIDSSAVPIEYKGELWYPYGTKITITYNSENILTNHANIYDVKSNLMKTEINGSISGWSSNKSNIYTTSLGYSSTYYAKNTEYSPEVSLKVNIMPPARGTMSPNYYKLNEIYPVKITESTGNVYGNNIYIMYDYTNGTSRSSYVSSAATHMGLIKSGETKVVYIKIVQSPVGGYIGVTKNNIGSANAKNIVANGFMFVTEDGKEILEPIINSVSTSGGTDSITVTVDSIGQNETNIEKYYYKLDNNDAIETDQSVYTFDNTNLYKTHTIKVYVKDENGAVSQTKEVVTNVVQANALPTITLDTEPIEYKGELWYPYGTKMTITYAEDMTNLTGYYAYIDERSESASQSSWSTNSSSTYTTTLNYSVTYIAKTLYKTNAKETDEVRLKINILPSDTSGPIYYTSIDDKIYPVQVTGKTSGTTYGTDVYMYNSNVNVAAMHMGLVKNGETKLLQIKIVQAPTGGYKGSTRNGVTTSSYTYTYNGFVFVDESGNEITRPQIISANTSSGDNAISVTVNATSNNGNIEKYYYSIDNGEYVETNENHYTFSNVTTSGNRNIKIYVKDSTGEISSIKEVYGYRNTPNVTITFNQEPIEYNGEKWYPYGTRIYINFSNSDTGYYMCANPQTNKITTNWTTTRYYPYNATLSETMIYEAYNYNSISGEGEHVREKINIMPNPDSLQSNYYAYGSGKVYPVTVTGKTGSGYGADTYCAYSSYYTPIGVAAVHKGLLQIGETKTLYIKIVPCPEGGYKGSTRNGITTSSLSGAYNGYVFVE